MTRQRRTRESHPYRADSRTEALETRHAGRAGAHPYRAADAISAALAGTPTRRSDDVRSKETSGLSCRNQPEVRAGVRFSARRRRLIRYLKQFALRHLDVSDGKFTKKLASLLN
jgi:hypothetical protein